MSMSIFGKCKALANIGDVRPSDRVHTTYKKEYHISNTTCCSTELEFKGTITRSTKN